DNATIYRIKAQLLLSANDNKPSEDMVTAYRTMLDLLDADPANKEKAASSYLGAYYLMGAYYLQNGDKDKAREYYTKYLEYRPDDAQVRSMLEKL
ncbi:MAG: tetratricopeptide repeat protein, partial [Paramuribaculum sp.]|nr:tetratricopeptide repeat protein [Paramuribaculum sp.]